MYKVSGSKHVWISSLEGLIEQEVSCYVMQLEWENRRRFPMSAGNDFSYKPQRYLWFLPQCNIFHI